MEKREVLSEFTRSRLIGYAELLDEIAGSYLEQVGEENADNMLKANTLQRLNSLQENIQSDLKDDNSITPSRETLFAKKEARESCIFFSRFIHNASSQLENLASTQFEDSTISQKQEKKICKELKNAGLQIRDYYRKENRNGYQEIGMIIRSITFDYYDVGEIADLLTHVTHKNMLPATDGYQYVHNDYIPLCFQEETCFDVFAGYSKATKESEEISGDNYLLRDFGDGTYIAAIADGMGSGELACKDSEKVLNLLEKYMESGLTVLDCVHACNEIFYMKRERESSVTFDVFELNQYTGECHFYKCGAAPSFLIRGNKVRQIAGDKLPLGISLQQAEYDETYYLQSQDRIIMLSDGVLDIFYDHMDLLESALTNLNDVNPSETASTILQNAIMANGGLIIDDMTVLVLGVYEKEDV